MKYILYIFVVLGAVSCSTDSEVPFFVDLDLQDSIPERIFYFDLEYESLYKGEATGQEFVSFPTPFSKTSYSSFDATSESRTEDGLRFVLCNLKQGLHIIEDSLDANGTPALQDLFELDVKLNLAVEGDVGFGSLFEKEQLTEFLTIGKTFGSDPDSLGHIALLGEWQWLQGSHPSTEFFYINRQRDKQPELRDYSITIVDVEDYQDLDRGGSVIKEALKVTAEIEGTVQVSTDGFGEQYPIDQLNISNGTLVFLVDYQ